MPLFIIRILDADWGGGMHTRNDMRCTKGCLLNLRKELIRILIQLHLPNISNRKHLLRPNFCWIKDIELDIIFLAFRTDLNAESPRGKDSLVNGTVQVSAVEIRILTSDFQGFVPDKRMHSEGRSPVEFDEMANSSGVCEGVGVDAETLHHSEGSWDSAITHGPHEHVG
jgi:hypothetical protein